MAAAMAGTTHSRGAHMALGLGPTLYVLGALVLLAREPIIDAGLDLAKVQGLIGLPLLVLAPGVLALAWLPGGPGARARWVAAGMTIAITLGETAVVASGISQIGCQPVTPPLGGLGQALVLGLAGGASFATSLALATGPAAEGRVLGALARGALAAGGGYLLQLLFFAALFMPVSCAYVP